MAGGLATVLNGALDEGIRFSITGNAQFPHLKTSTTDLNTNNDQGIYVFTGPL